MSMCALLGSYIYCNHLLTLNGGGFSQPCAQTVNVELSEVSTPMNVAAWESALAKHPDSDFACYVASGLRYGFHIGVDSSHTLTGAKANMLSARQNPSVVEKYLNGEVRLGNIKGPFPPGMLPNIHINRFGCIPKKHQPGKWRLITDLSHPSGCSVNDAIDSHLCSLSYISVDQVARRAMELGVGSMLAKTDIKSAYRLVPVHPEDRHLLGMEWGGRIYVDGMLPFGLRSAPKIFTAVADALEWCIRQAGAVNVFHYLDDFVVLGSPDSEACRCFLDILERVCAHLGVPLAPEKTEGPSRKITFLGIVIDTNRGELSLPKDKMERLLLMVRQWRMKKSCTRKELESLIGSLQHACKVIRPGRSFLRRAISALSIAKKPHQFIRLNKEFKSDMAWWATFAEGWNGTGIIIYSDKAQVVLTSDASGTWGCGAWSGQSWFQVEWNDATRQMCIAVKELMPIIISAVIWGPEWKGKSVCARCDNKAVVDVLGSRSCKDKDLMQLLRSLFFLEASYQFQLSAEHIAGADNDLADDLSRNKLGNFKEKALGMNTYPSHVPDFLLQWLLQPCHDWSSPSWIQQFIGFVARE